MGLKLLGLLVIPLVLLLIPLVVPFFISDSNNSGGFVVEQVETVEFPGGAFVVTRQREDYRSPFFYFIDIQTRILSKEDISLYVGSRMDALDQLLENSDPEIRFLQSLITFKNPVPVADFEQFFSGYLEKYGEIEVLYRNDFTNETLVEVLISDWERERGVLDAGRTNSTALGIVMVNAVLTIENAKALREDSRIILIDTSQDPVLEELVTKYSPNEVFWSRPYFWEEYVKWYLT